MKKIMIMAMLFAGNAYAFPNSDFCDSQVDKIAQAIMSFGDTSNLKVVGHDFLGDLQDVRVPQQGVYKVTFDNNETAELRLSNGCAVMGYEYLAQ